MKQRQLYLEQRIGIVRARLNQESLAFQELLPPGERPAFRRWVLGMMDVLEGLPLHFAGMAEDGLTPEERERFGVS